MYGPDKLDELRGGPQEPMVRQPAAAQPVGCSSCSGTTSRSHFEQHEPDNARSGCEGTFNGGKAEQKGVEFNGELGGTERLNLDVSAFLADPEFTEDTLVPEPGRGLRDRKGWTHAGVARARSTGSRPSTRSRTSCRCRVTSGRRSRTATRARSGTDLDGSQDYRQRRSGGTRAALDQLLPSWSRRRCSLDSRSDSGWETALIVRNLFDEQGYQLAELAPIDGDALRRSALALRAYAAAAADGQPLVHARNGDAGGPAEPARVR